MREPSESKNRKMRNDITEIDPVYNDNIISHIYQYPVTNTNYQNHSIEDFVLNNFHVFHILILVTKKIFEKFCLHEL